MATRETRMDLPKTSSDAITSQPNVNNPDLHVIQQALSSLNTGAPRSLLHTYVGEATNEIFDTLPERVTIITPRWQN